MCIQAAATRCRLFKPAQDRVEPSCSSSFGAMASDDAANSADARQLAEVMAYLKLSRYFWWAND
jgi:hypothetical protein